MASLRRALLIGFGSVGRRLCHLLGDELPQHPQLRTIRPVLVGIFSGSHGAWVEPGGIDPARATMSFDELGQLDPNSLLSSEMTPLQAIEEMDFEVLIELSTLSIRDRGQPALSHVQAALERGRHVVTANKGPLAFAWDDLQRLAHRHQARLLYESTVLDGLPVFNLGRGCLSSARVLALEGILNCTSNYVLAKGLESGNWKEALAEAQREGFAEADSSLDLLGWDAACKLSILANHYLHSSLRPDQIPRDEVTPALIERLKVRQSPGDCWRVVGHARFSEGSVHAQVELMNLPSDHCFRVLTPDSGGLLLHSDLLSPVFIAQRQPRLNDTAFGVLQDLAALPAA